MVQVWVSRRSTKTGQAEGTQLRKPGNNEIGSYIVEEGMEDLKVLKTFYLGKVAGRDTFNSC